MILCIPIPYKVCKYPLFYNKGDITIIMFGTNITQREKIVNNLI